MPYLTSERALRSIMQSPGVLKALLTGVSADQAQQSRDGADGWRVVEVVGHLLDYEDIFMERARGIAAGQKPQFVGRDQDALVRERGYATQDVHDVFDRFLAKRRELIAYLQGLSEAQWNNVGIHPRMGEMTLIETILHTGLHDLNHLEQISRALGRAERL